MVIRQTNGNIICEQFCDKFKNSCLEVIGEMSSIFDILCVKPVSAH